MLDLAHAPRRRCRRTGPTRRAPAHWHAATSIPTRFRLTARPPSIYPRAPPCPTRHPRLHPAIPADSAAEPSGSPPTVALRSTADEYPIWGHLPGGLLSRLPGTAADLVGSASAAPLSRPRWSAPRSGWRRPDDHSPRPPSSLPSRPWRGACSPSSTRRRWRSVAPWRSGPDCSTPRSRHRRRWRGSPRAVRAALALPRRDGLIWACIALAIALGRAGRTFAQWWRALGVGPQIVVAGSTLVTAAWGITNDSRVSRLVTLSPLILVAAESARWLWRERVRGRIARIVLLSAGAVLAALGAAVVLVSRPAAGTPASRRASSARPGTTSSRRSACSAGWTPHSRRCRSSSCALRSASSSRPRSRRGRATPAGRSASSW